MCTSKPKTPKPPEPVDPGTLPEQAHEVDYGVLAAKRDQRIRASLASGHGSTIKTGGRGLTDKASTVLSSLFGEGANQQIAAVDKGTPKTTPGGGGNNGGGGGGVERPRPWGGGNRLDDDDPFGFGGTIFGNLWNAGLLSGGGFPTFSGSLFSSNQSSPSTTTQVGGTTLTSRTRSYTRQPREIAK